MPAAVYHAAQAVSATALKAISRTPAHAKFQLDNPRQSEALTKGTALHTAVLEPDVWATKYVKAPKFDRRTTIGKNGFADWQIRCATEGLTSLDPDQHAAVSKMADRVRNHSTAAERLAAKTHVELSIFWIDDLTGLLCKCRVDLLTARILTDLKTTKNAEEVAFMSDAARLGYHIQLAHYSAGLMAHGMARPDFSIIAVENVPPHEPIVYDLADDWLVHGRRERGRRLKLVAECLKSGVWSGYPDKPVELPFPVWAIDSKDMHLTLDGAQLDEVESEVP